jgi:hypothetical protein
MKSRASRHVSDEKKAEGKRKHRARPTPRWLLDKQGLDEIAQRRCLLVLEVLSGARPVTDVLAEAQLSRGTYYKLEERALGAMLRALSPAAGADGTDGQALAAALARTAELEAKLRQTEKEKRRADKLAFLTRKLVKAGPLTTGVGRLPGSRNRPRSTMDGPKPSRASRPSASDATTTPAGGTDSTPTADGATAR